MLVIGLTGSIASGKSETSKLFSSAGIPVFDADAEVHEIYASKSFVTLLASQFPDAVHNGSIDRMALGKIVLDDMHKLKMLESLVHPLVRAKREKFISHWKDKKSSFVVLDIPLLYETGQNQEVDRIIVVSTPENDQRKRALARPGMTEAKLAGMLARQMPDSEKRKRADFVIENSGSLDQLREQVETLIAKFNAMGGSAK
jgi:dephospho-CoA kinase